MIMCFKLHQSHWKLIVLAIFVLLLTQNSSIAVGAQQGQAQPSNKLLVTVGQKSETSNTLVQYDFSTKETVPFYTDPQVGYVRALAWSPKGNLLAILRVTMKDGGISLAEICVLTAAGQLRACMDEKPPAFSTGYEAYFVTWREDEQALYFVSLTETSVRLVEADTNSGKALRLVYEHKLADGEIDALPQISWTTTLSHVLVGSGNYPRIGLGFPIYLANLQADQKVELSRAGSEDQVPCAGFSPQNSYFTAIQVKEKPGAGRENIGFTIFRIQGSPERSMLAREYLGVLPACSIAWQNDERAFYYTAWRTDDNGESFSFQIMKYDLDTNQFAGGYKSEPIGDYRERFMTALKLSPNEAYLAFGLGYSVVVVSTTGEFQKVDVPYSWVSDPVWMPNSSGK